MSGERLDAAFDRIETACPVCGGDRWTVESDPDDPTGSTPMQVPCWDAEHVVVIEERAALALLADTPSVEPLDLEVPTHDHDSYMHAHGGARHIHRFRPSVEPAGMAEAWRACEEAIAVRRSVGWGGGDPLSLTTNAPLADGYTASATGSDATGDTTAHALQALATLLRESERSDGR